MYLVAPAFLNLTSIGPGLETEASMPASPPTTDSPLHREAHAQHGSARAIKRLSEHALGLTNDALDLVRIATGKMHLNLVTADVHAIFDASIQAARVEIAATRRIDVQAVVKANFPQWVLVDAIRFRHVLEILVANACKVGNDPHIIVEADNFHVPNRAQSPLHGLQAQQPSTSTPDTTARIAVTITDWAISSVQADMLLHPYYHQTISTSDLSLSLAESLAVLMGGSFTIHSPTSRSTTFTFTLPIKEVAPPPGPTVLPATSATLERHMKTLSKSPTRTLSDILLVRNEIIAGHDAPEGVPAPVVPVSRSSSRLDSSGHHSVDDMRSLKTGENRSSKKSPSAVSLRKSVGRAQSGSKMDLGPIFTANSLPTTADIAEPARLATTPKTPEEPTLARTPEIIPESSLNPPPPITPPPPKAILIVDDSSINRTILAKIFRIHHPQFVVHEVANGTDAVERCMQTMYELIFMDLEMPQMGGQEATRRLRLGGIKSPIVVTTAHNLKADKATELRQEGVNDILAKPITRAKVAEVLEKFCGFMKGENGEAGNNGGRNGNGNGHGNGKGRGNKREEYEDSIGMGSNGSGTLPRGSASSSPGPARMSMASSAGEKGLVDPQGPNQRGNTNEAAIDRRTMLFLTRTSSPAAEHPILIVDDDLITRSLVKRIIGIVAPDRDMMEADNGADAVMLCTKGSTFALIFMDLEMPRMDGDIAASRIRGMYPAGQCPPIVAMTAHHLSAESVSALHTSGISEIIIKPPTRDSITSILQTYRVIHIEHDSPSPLFRHQSDDGVIPRNSSTSIRHHRRPPYAEHFANDEGRTSPFPQAGARSSDDSLSSCGSRTSFDRKSLDSVQLPLPPKPATPTPAEAKRGRETPTDGRTGRSGRETSDRLPQRDDLMKKHRTFSQSLELPGNLKRGGAGSGSSERLGRRETIASSAARESKSRSQSPDMGVGRRDTFPREIKKSPSVN
ncbi:hypothetical protein HDV00_004894 [Rhizophlyctis rosea]|nr:hypothetical protein HDV00_004894 [Rhizophlyctis rosea]